MPERRATETEPMTSTDPGSAAGPPAAVGEPDGSEPAGPALGHSAFPGPVPTAAPAQTDGAAQLASVEARLAAITRQLAEDTARAAARERVIDRQHAEIERLRSAERGGLLRPVVTDLYRLRNDLLRQAATTPAEITAERVRAMLRSFADEAADALERCGVAIIAPASGVAVDPARHQVTDTAPTADPERDATVGELLQDGYFDVDTGKVIAPARITVHRYQEAADD